MKYASHEVLGTFLNRLEMTAAVHKYILSYTVCTRKYLSIREHCMKRIGAQVDQCQDLHNRRKGREQMGGQTGKRQ